MQPEVVQPMNRIETELRLIRQQMEEDFLLHSERIEAQQQSIQRVERALDSVRQEFRDFAHTTLANHDSWLSDRQRNLRMLDVLQSGLLTGGLESESRLERIERRLSRLEENQSGAA